MIFGKVLGGIQEMVEINANAHGKLITYLEYFVFFCWIKLVARTRTKQYRAAVSE